jgi:hypothetical protein
MKCCPKRRYLLLLGTLLLFSLMIAACSQEPQTVEVTRVVEVPGPEVEVEVPGPEVEVTRIVEVMAEPEMEESASAVAVVPFEEQWASSPHADASAEAFVHWDEDDPAEVPTSCAKCHSTPGYLDYIGADGTEANVVDNPAPIGTTVTCEACHNDVTVNMTSVLMPSGIELMGLGDESRCMQCHQGRHSTVSVNASIEEAGLADSPDEVSEDLGFSNIHYYAAAATQYGTMAKGGYEYDGKVYDSKFDHVEGYDTCISCHNPHTLEVRVEECTVCHTDVTSVEDFADVRMQGSLVDYDGDGDMEEGVSFEIEGMRELLYTAMLAYANEVAGTPIAYNVESHPYFFIDGDGDGVASEEESARDNAFNAWTPRLAKAAYNYQVSLKDPGRFAHGGKYIIQLLYDSIEDLNEALAEPVDLSNARRIDHGHFAGSEEAFRHWDEEGMVPGSCSKCHSAAGLPQFIHEGVTTSQPTANGLNCATCHSDLSEFTIYEVEQVTFPSGATVGFEDVSSNLCINCHQGRESTVSVDRAIGDSPDDEVAEGLSFRNVHYFAAGATLFGSEVQGAYQYEGQEYAGHNEHVPGFDSCVECHSIHELEVEVEECGDCHEGVESEEDLVNIRVSEIDYDGDGDVEEGIAGEVQTIADALLAAIQANATNNAATDSIVYSTTSYPYFFIDANSDGVYDEGDTERYVTWTPALLRAAYNYQYAQKDPGAFAHNAPYVIQVLYDSLADMGGDVTAMTRPAVVAEAES